MMCATFKNHHTVLKIKRQMSHIIQKREIEEGQAVQIRLGVIIEHYNLKTITPKE